MAQQWRSGGIRDEELNAQSFFDRVSVVLPSRSHSQTTSSAVDPRPALVHAQPQTTFQMAASIDAVFEQRRRSNLPHAGMIAPTTHASVSNAPTSHASVPRPQPVRVSMPLRPVPRASTSSEPTNRASATDLSMNIGTSKPKARSTVKFAGLSIDEPKPPVSVSKPIHVFPEETDAHGISVLDLTSSQIGRRDSAAPQSPAVSVLPLVAQGDVQPLGSLVSVPIQHDNSRENSTTSERLISVPSPSRIRQANLETLDLMSIDFSPNNSLESVPALTPSPVVSPAEEDLRASKWATPASRQQWVEVRDKAIEGKIRAKQSSIRQQNIANMRGAIATTVTPQTSKSPPVPVAAVKRVKPGALIPSVLRSVQEKVHIPEGTLIDISPTTASHPSSVPIQSVGSRSETPVKRQATNDLEHQLYFDSWKKPEHRVGGPARTREVKFTGLPITSSARTVAGLVYGGALEHIVYRPGSSSATVRFVRPDDCRSFYDKTANGIKAKWPGDRLSIIWVQLGKEVDTISGQLQHLIERGCTRVIRAVGLAEDWTLVKMQEYGKGPSQIASLEQVELHTRIDGAKTIRTGVWSFCNVQDASLFKAARVYDPDFEHCNVQFAPDPCAESDGHRFILD